MIVKWKWTSAALLMFLSTASHAGIAVQERKICPVGGQKFETTGTVSCTTYGMSQDFFLKGESSCDFVTRLPQCPDNKLPLYKEFTASEVKLLEGYLASEDYLAIEGRSRFYIAKKVDDFLVANGSPRVMDFTYLIGGLQHDRERNEGDSEYRQWVLDAGTADIDTADAGDAPYIHMLMAYTAYLGGEFDTASVQLSAVRGDAAAKGNAFVQAYVSRVTQCVQAKDSSLCPSTDYVVPQNQRR